ncbi:MAG: hypothetical protein JW395_0212 [Nitrospira sp.]|nr:hypothetical protein [Nitrospira sp.]
MPSVTDDEFVALVHEYRDEKIPPLEFQPGLERLIDSDHCRQLSGNFSRHGKWEKKIAAESIAGQIPAERGLYMFVWTPEFAFTFEGYSRQPSWILYVGKAGVEEGTNDTLRHRFSSEYRRFVGGDPRILWEPSPPQDRRARLEKYLTLRPLEYWFLIVPNICEIMALEKKLLKMFRPPLNYQHTWGARLRPLATRPAF